MKRRIFVAALLLAPAACATQPWRQVPLTAASYDDETHDYGIAPTNIIRTGDYDAPTPTAIAGATTITTPQLRAMMLASPPPMLIDVIGGNPTASLPNAIWLHGAGLGTGLHDALQQHLGQRLAELLDNDKSKPVVFFCLSKTCWLSHNAAVRAVALGYTRVYWYRGGRKAWQAAALGMEPVQASKL